MGWIGVDFDGTLAEYTTYKGPGIFGAPVPAMVERVKAWLAEGKAVKIFTARAADPDEVTRLYGWCQEHLGVVLEVTNVKDYLMVALYDDRCVQVESNTGRLLDQMVSTALDQLIVERSRHATTQNALDVARGMVAAGEREVIRLRQYIERLTTTEQER